MQYINTTYRRTGTRWDSRYTSSLIQAETPASATSNSTLFAPHPLYLALGSDDKQRHAAYRALFRTQLDKEAIDDIRLALNQNQPLGNNRFYAKIEKLTGERREAKPRGRPRVPRDDNPDATHRQGKLEV